MRFAFAGFDQWRGVFDAFIAESWEPLALFTVPVDHRSDFHDEVVARAGRHGIPVQMSRIREQDLRALGEKQCDLLVVAGYTWKIPDWTPYLPHAINFHPSPLPEGRGPYPLFRAILENRREWGVSCHRIAPDLDTGDILAANPLALAPDECHETLQLKLQIATQRLASRVATNFHALWKARQPQQGGSYWPRITDAERTLDFSRPVAEILRVARALGWQECIAPVGHGKSVYVRRAAGWVEPHAHAPGSLVHQYRREIVVAAQDGFIALLEWNPISPLTRAGLGM